MSVPSLTRTFLCVACCGLIVATTSGCSSVSNGPAAALTVSPKLTLASKGAPVSPVERHKAGTHGTVKMLEVGWALTRPPHKKTVEIASTVSWCTSFPKPSIRRVGRLESPHAVILTAIVGFPKPSAPGEQGDCLAVELLVRKVVHLDRVLGDRAIYDGGHSPPARRWPRPNRD